MRASAKGSGTGQPVNTTDFLASSGWFVGLTRTATSRLALVPYRGDGTNNEARFHFFCGDSVFCPPNEDEMICEARFAHSLGTCDSVTSVSAFKERPYR